MTQSSRDHRLCSISTVWSLVLAAHQAEGVDLQAAQKQLLERYGGAVRRYLMSALRDPDAVEELFQEFALRFLDGQFHKVAPDKGRFRDYVKTVLFHLIGNHRKRRFKDAAVFTDDLPEQAVEVSLEVEQDPEFIRAWREELLLRCWANLAASDQATGQVHFTVLRQRTENPTSPSAQLAEELTTRLGKPVSTTTLRQMLHRAREKFAELILDEVTQSLADPTDEKLADELIVLGLIEYCRSALKRRTSE